MLATSDFLLVNLYIVSTYEGVVRLCFPQQFFYYQPSIYSVGAKIKDFALYA